MLIINAKSFYACAVTATQSLGKFEADSRRITVRDHWQQSQTPSAEGYDTIVREGDGKHSVGVADPRMQAV